MTYSCVHFMILNLKKCSNNGMENTLKNSLRHMRSPLQKIRPELYSRCEALKDDCRAVYSLISDTSVCYLLSSGSTSQHNIKPWNQKWRKPLRGAIQWLSTELARIYEHEMEGLFHEPWTIRDAYGELIINRSYDAIIAFFSNHAKRTPNPQEITRCLKLLEMQKLIYADKLRWFLMILY